MPVYAATPARRVIAKVPAATIEALATQFDAARFESFSSVGRVADGKGGFRAEVTLNFDHAKYEDAETVRGTLKGLPCVTGVRMAGVFSSGVKRVVLECSPADEQLVTGHIQAVRRRQQDIATAVLAAKHAAATAHM